MKAFYEDKKSLYKEKTKEEVASEWSTQGNQLQTKLLDFMKIYNQSLENIVEGQREVIRNDEFRFADQETAKEKEEKLRRWVQSIKSQKFNFPK